MKRSWLALGAVALVVAGVGGSACRKNPPPARPEEPPVSPWAEQPGDEIPVPGGEVVVHLEYDPAHLNLLILPDGWLYRITLHMIHETLVREDPATYAYVGGLAENWDVSPDKLVTTFHLRKGVRWHDGTPFSSRDVKFTFDKIMDPTVLAQSARGALEPFGCRGDAPDDSTFRLACKKPYFLLLTALDEIPILPAHAMGDGDLNTHPLNARPLGTGPFRFDHWTRGSEIVLKRNDEYWGKKAYLDRIVYRFVENPLTAVQLAAKGEIDFDSRVREAQWFDLVLKDTRIRDNFNKFEDEPNQFSFLSLNCGRPVFEDARVRRAMAHLFDADRICKDLMHGLCERTATFYDDKAPGFHDGLLPYPFDTERAAQLLDAAGWKDSDGDGVRDKGGKPLQLTFLLSVGSTTMEKVVTAYQEDLRKAGVRMDIVRIEWAQMLERARKHDFDMMGMINTFFTPRIDPSDNFHSTQIKDGQNWAAYRSAEMDKLLDAMHVELDEPKRSEVDRRIQELAYEDLPYVPLFRQKIPGIVHKRIHGVKTSVEWYRLEDWWIPKRLQAEPRIWTPKSPSP